MTRHSLFSGLGSASTAQPCGTCPTCGGTLYAGLTHGCTTGVRNVPAAPYVASRAPRKYAMTRLKRGDYLLPSNDAKTLWRIGTYEEDGSAEYGDGKKVTGLFWALWRRPFPSPGVAFDLEDWDAWQFWSGMHKTRDEAIKEALRVTV